jgi:glycosyltransferase involved in cell wall biosynthesis
MARVRPLVTIGLTTYNRADSYLKKALGSALAQTYANLEIIVSDNGSTDGTEALVRSVGCHHIRYVRHPKNIGANNNANFCVQQAQGAYFLLLHDDDVIDDDFVEVCMDAVKDDTTIGVIRTGVRVIDREGKTLSQTFNRVARLSTVDFFLGWFSGKTAWYLCNTLYNTRALQTIGGFRSPTNHLDDCVATARLAAEAGRTDVFEVKASFRRHGHNKGSTVDLREWCEDSLFLLELMARLAPDRAEQLKQQGLRFFCDQNYSRASRSTHPLFGYMLVYRKLGYAHLPFAFLLSKYLTRGRRYWRNKATGHGLA